MLFNTLDFAVFLPIIFILYWIVTKHLKLQNILIVVASYVFYGWWDWRFLTLIFLSTLVDYLIGLGLCKYSKQNFRKTLLLLSIIVNLGFLGFFKYYNFFVDNFVDVFSFFGSEIKPNSLNIILPVGISFYTFQTMSYTIDVYRKKTEMTRDFVAFAAFVSFFPQLVAGPIERASNLLHQFTGHRNFQYGKAVDGLRQILWGLFKKIVVADNCAEYANLIFNKYEDCSGSTLVLGTILFAFQIYGDFSGYSDIAIGTARLFGFNLRRNFAFPYFSRDIAEFWRRWHISLTTWFRDYIYIPLGGSRGNILSKIRNTLIIFIVSGFWHGAKWTFIAWGVLNAIYFIPLIISGRNRKHIEIVAKGKYLPDIKDFFRILGTFGLTLIGWVFFRADNLNHAINYFVGIFSASLFTLPATRPSAAIIFSLIFIVIEWMGREQEYAIAGIDKKLPKPVRWILYYAIIFSIIFYTGIEQQFIYFQF